MSIEVQTKIGLLSKALVLCGEAPLNSLSDDRYGATVGSALYEILYENELQSNRWRFSMAKGALSRLVDTPLNEWMYAYQLPSAMLLPIGIYPPNLRYEIYSDRIYTDATSVDLEYLFKPEITVCPAYFTLLLVYALYRDMVGPITASEAKVKIAKEMYRQQRDRALFSDAQGRPARPVMANPFTDVR
jgi:hypothetical protein